MCDTVMSSVEFLTCPVWESVGEDETIQVVGLVLETASECSGTDYFNVVAVLILSTANRVIGTRCFYKGTRRRETTFIHLYETTTPSVSEGDGGITHQTDSPVPLGVITVENEYSEINTNLSCRETRSFRRRVRRKHVGEQCLQRGTEIRNLARGRVHDWLAPSHDGQHPATANQLFYRHYHLCVVHSCSWIPTGPTTK